MDERPAPRRPRRSKKPAGNALLIVGLILGGFVVLAGAGGAVAYALWPAKKPTTQTASPTAPAPGDPTPGAEFRQGTGSTPPAEGGNATQPSAGRQVFDANGCAKCHRIDGGAAAGGKGGRTRGPDLSRVGADPTHTAEWIAAFVRNPKAHNPTSRMPSYGEGRIQPEELRALAAYLASLK